MWVSRDEAIGPIHYLIVSSDAYNAAFADRRVIAVEIDTRALYHGIYREPVNDVGTALLDRLVWVTRDSLTTHVGDLHPTRHAPVTAQIRELIGN
ncbi:hypothetical protein [Pseudonocardia sp. ICBG1142]|uniref:hypothetical protein n=1 Tax=Pseudonocardia sp. ICBG1142 TaxID=2846760 RepID=UPI001CF6BE76|nr:hypothetical protein [Pseudonocardia sp. ICBG1142]